MSKSFRTYLKFCFFSVGTQWCSNIEILQVLTSATLLDISGRWIIKKVATGYLMNFWPKVKFCTKLDRIHAEEMNMTVKLASWMM